jgi:hypothetical protein
MLVLVRSMEDSEQYRISGEARRMLVLAEQFLVPTAFSHWQRNWQVGVVE